jgi:hypothetical protein
MRILRGLSSKWLPCECLVGVYETYDGLVVTIIDAKGTGCTEPSHRAGHVVPREEVRAAKNPAKTPGTP